MKPSRQILNISWYYTITNTILSPWNCVAQLSVSQEKNFDNPESNSWSNPTKIGTNDLYWAVTCLFEVRTFLIGAAREAFKNYFITLRGVRFPVSKMIFNKKMEKKTFPQTPLQHFIRSSFVGIHKNTFWVIFKDRFKGENTLKSFEYSLKMLFKFFKKRQKKR